MIARSVIDQSVIHLRQLVRLTAGTCYVAIVIAAFGIIGVFVGARTPSVTCRRCSAASAAS